MSAPCARQPLASPDALQSAPPRALIPTRQGARAMAADSSRCDPTASKPTNTPTHQHARLRVSRGARRHGRALGEDDAGQQQRGHDADHNARRARQRHHAGVCARAQQPPVGCPRAELACGGHAAQAGAGPADAPGQAVADNMLCRRPGASSTSARSIFLLGGCTAYLLSHYRVFSDACTQCIFTAAPPGMHNMRATL